MCFIRTRSSRAATTSSERAGGIARQFNLFEAEAKRLMDAQLALPAYEMVLKCSHTFNLLDARGAISVTERAGTSAVSAICRAGRAELLRLA